MMTSLCKTVMYTVQCIIQNVELTMYTVPCIMLHVQYIMLHVQCTMYNPACTMYNVLWYDVLSIDLSFIFHNIHIVYIV